MLSSSADRSAGLEVGDQRRQTLGLHAFMLGDGDMGVDLIGGVEARADYQNGDLADIVGQVALAVIARVKSQIALPIAGSCSHGFHGPISAPSSAHGLEGVEIAGDALAHVVVERLLLGGQVGGSDQGEAHLESPGVKSMFCGAGHYDADHPPIATGKI